MHSFKNKLNRIIYQNDIELINSPAKKDMDRFIVQSVFGSIFGILTGGIFLTGYLIYLNISDEIISFAGLIPSICGILMVFCANLVEKQERKRSLVVVLNMAAKITLFLIILVPLFVPSQVAIPIVYFLIISGYVLNSVTALAINTWFIKVVPLKIRGRYFSSRQIVSVFVSVVIPISAGKVLDLFHDKYTGFLIMYIIALVFAFLETFMFSKISNPAIQNLKNPLKIKDLFLVPMRDKAFLRFTISMALFHILIHMSFSFTSVYMIKYIGLSYTYITAVSIISALLQVLVFYKFWGIVTDNISANFTLTTSIWFYTFDALLWFFNVPSTIRILLPFCNFFGAINVSGFTVGSFNRRFELMPEEGRVIYDSFYTAAIGFALLLSPIIGSVLRNAASKVSFIDSMEYGSFRIVFLLSTIGIVLFQCYQLLHLKKADPANECLKKSSYIYTLRVLKGLFHKL